jgi:peroxiredoxin
MNKLLCLLLFPVLGFAQTPAKEFKLKGELKLAKPIDWIYINYASGDQRIYDSLQAPAGEFKYEGKIPEPTVATIYVKFVKQPGEERAVRDVLQVFLEPGKIDVYARDSLKANSVTGSAGHVDFAALLKEQQPYNDRMIKLSQEYVGYRAKGDEAAMKKVEDAMEKVQSEMDEKVYGNFVKTHPNSSVAVYALNRYAGWDIDPAKIEPLFNSLPADKKLYPSAVALKERVEISKKTAVGKYALDFTQNDTLGKPVSLSSFKGKYVLVDFWASWCGPCRQENPNVVKAFNKFRDKNFTILGVSLDRPNAKDRWLKAIHDDGLAWNHVSDLKYWDNEVAKLYGIRAIPQNLLLDPQGKIIARNLNGEALDKKLEEVIK